MFVRAEKTGRMRTTYWTEDGSTETYVGGNRTWRNQNPGNIGAGSWAARHGAIGKAERFAVFPSYEVGRAAIFDLLLSPNFKNQSIWDVIPHYAPAKENDVKWYRDLVRDATGLDLKRKIRDLKKEELVALVNAVERAEGKFKPGKIIKKQNRKKISAVRKDKKKIITHYFVSGIGWLSKPEAIQLTLEGRIDAVIAHSSSGAPYLRTRPDNDVRNNLGNLG